MSLLSSSSSSLSSLSSVPSSPPSSVLSTPDDIFRLICLYLTANEKLLSVMQSCHRLRSLCMTAACFTQAESSIAITARLLRSVSRGSAVYGEFIGSLSLSLTLHGPCCEGAIRGSMQAAAFLSALEPPGHHRPQSIQQFEDEQDKEEDEEEDEEESAEAEHKDQASFDRLQCRFDYGPDIELTLRPLPRPVFSALRGLVSLDLEDASVPLPTLCLLLSHAPRLRAFSSTHCRRVSSAALLLLSRLCPALEKVVLHNERSSVLRMTAAAWDKAEQAVDELLLSGASAASSAPPASLTALQTLEIGLPGFNADVDDAGFARLLLLLRRSVHLVGFSFTTLASLSFQSLQLLAAFPLLRELNFNLCSRPAAYALYCDSAHTEPVLRRRCGLPSSGLRFVPNGGRAAFFTALQRLSGDDDRTAHIAQAVQVVENWPKGDNIDVLLCELPRDLRRPFAYDGCCAMDEEDEDDDDEQQGCGGAAAQRKRRRRHAQPHWERRTRQLRHPVMHGSSVPQQAVFAAPSPSAFSAPAPAQAVATSAPCPLPPFDLSNASQSMQAVASPMVVTVVSASALPSVADARVVCRYGAQCYRKNPQHFAQFRHPHLERTKDEEERDKKD